MIVFTPLSRPDLAALREAPMGGPIASHAATPGLYETFSLGPADDEEAERTALLIAGLSGLLIDEVRIVVVSEDPDPLDDETAFGEVTLSRLSWSDVTAIFADDPAAAPAVAKAAAAAHGLGLDGGWDAEPVQTFMTEHDLLWYGPEEIGTLIGG